MLMKLLKKSNRGFTLIELLLVVAIIGMIAMIAVPSMLSALNKAKQKRTIADMRSIAISLEIYQIDYAKYPQSGAANLLSLEPKYMRSVPLNDGWLAPFGYATGASRNFYSLGSGGSDRSTPDWSTAPGTTHSFTDDIILYNGTFTVYPEGVQT